MFVEYSFRELAQRTIRRRCTWKYWSGSFKDCVSAKIR